MACRSRWDKWVSPGRRSAGAGRYDQQQGLAFSGHPAGPADPEDPDPTLAFEWTLCLDATTRAWLVTSPGGYTVDGVKLDIVPVRLQRPLFRPLAAPQGR
jgi:hypothetical protein